MMKNLKITIADIFFSVLLAGELSLLVDTVSVFCERALSASKFVIMFSVLTVILLLIPAAGKKMRKAAALGIFAVVGIPLLLGAVCWYTVSQSVKYTEVDDGKAALYAGQTVLLLVPHQDDDINVLGGVMEEYVKYGSEVFVVFSTNGDYYDKAEVRFRESLNALAHLGVPEDHVLFLGYGDQWSPEGSHLYNAEPGQVMTSVNKKTETYGTAAAPAYRPGRAYTIDNFLQDIESVILEHRPDVIYCVDYDYNIDHRALSLAFEKVMGKILCTEEHYRPLVLKGYAYNTAWEAVNDFYSDNLLATQDAFAEMYNPVPEVYRWEDRVRLPVNAQGLSRSVVTADQGQALFLYKSQDAGMYAPRVINGDKVFWQRNTSSLTYQAEIQTSSADAGFLNDFMLLESRDLLQTGDTPFDGVWVPDLSDQEKQVRITFSGPEDISEVVLYDHPDPEKNVVNAMISFEDGTSLETGPLDPCGAANVVAVEKKDVSSLVITLTQLQGDAGLSEVEVFADRRDRQQSFVKFMDEAGNFAYDYWIDSSGAQMFKLYTGGAAPTDQAEYTISCSNADCTAVWKEEGIYVECPVGESCVVTVQSQDGVYSDSVCIRNPGSFERVWKLFWLDAEEMVMNLCASKLLHQRLFVCRLIDKLSAMG